MKPEIPEYLSDDLCEWIATHTGLHFPPKKRRSMHKGVYAAADELGFRNATGFITDLLRKPPCRQVIDTLVKYLTIGETFFLRDKQLFQILKDDIFRGILQNPRRAEKSIRIWSAACSTGEEPYSVAILIDQMGNLFQGWDITILGTDVNPVSLDKARAGRYTRWSFRDTPDAIIEKYFVPADAQNFEIIPRIRSMVRFEKLNFVETDYDRALRGCGPMDIILCRNVLMYFDADLRAMVISRLNRMLAENGWLIVGPAETGFVNEPGLTPVRFTSALMHRKGPPRQIESGASGSRRLREPVAKSVISPPGRRKSDGFRERPPNHDLYQEALAAFKKGYYRTAIRILSPVLKVITNSANGFLMLTESMALTAKAHANLGELGDAEHWCRTAIDHEKLNPEQYYLLATILQEGDRHPEAIKAVKQALYLDPEFIMGHFTLGLLMQQAGRIPESKKHLNNAIALLNSMGDDDPVPLSDGITAGRLRETMLRMA